MDIPSSFTTISSRSPACGPSGFPSPCWAPEGLKCSPAASKSGEVLPVSWMWTPCAPGPSAFCPGCRLALMVTPFGPSVKVASPTGLPFASSSCAVAIPPPWASVTPAPRVSSTTLNSTSKPARLLRKIFSSLFPDVLCARAIRAGEHSTRTGQGERRERRHKKVSVAGGLCLPEGFFRRDAPVACDGEHEQTVGHQPDGRDAQEKIPDKGLLEQRRQGAAEAPDLPFVGSEGCQDEEHSGDKEDHPAGRDAEPAAMLNPTVLSIAQRPELGVRLELGVVGLVDLVQAHADYPGPDCRDEQPSEREG